MNTPKINDGGPAFPLQSIGPDFVPGYCGMSLRDWIAGMALQGILANTNATRPNGKVSADGHEVSVVEFSYAVADAMMAERSKNAKSA